MENWKTFITICAADLAAEWRFIWDFVDQSRRISIDNSDSDQLNYFSDGEYTYKYKDELNGYYLGYGGKYGSEDDSSDSDFCCDGLVSPDRHPQPELYEVKYIYQNFIITASQDELAKQKIKICNENSFTDLNDYNVVWSVKENGKETATSVISDLSVKPGQTDTVTIPFAMPEQLKSGAEYTLTIKILLKEDNLWGKKGHEIAHEQFVLSKDTISSLPASNTNIYTTDSNGEIKVSGNDFSFSVNKKSGLIENYIYKDDILIEEGPHPQFWRAATDNDSHSYFAANDKSAMWQKFSNTLKAKSVTTGNDKNGRLVINVKMNSSVSKSTVNMKYTVDGCGAVNVYMYFEAAEDAAMAIQKIGTTMTLPTGYENMNWYGYGYEDNVKYDYNAPLSEYYPDRSNYLIRGLFSTTADKSFYPFVKPQDCGNIYADWLSVTKQNSDTGILVSNNHSFNAGILHYTADEINSAETLNELGNPSDKSYLNIDLVTMGTGNASCGDSPLADYNLRSFIYDENGNITFCPYIYEYTIIPYSKDYDDCFDLSSKWNNTQDKYSIKTNTKAKITKAVIKSGKLLLKWKKSNKHESFEIAVSTSKKFAKNKTKIYTITDWTRTSKKIDKLKKGQKVYYKIRAYKYYWPNNKKTKVNGAWSKTGSIKNS